MIMMKNGWTISNNKSRKKASPSGLSAYHCFIHNITPPSSPSSITFNQNFSYSPTPPPYDSPQYSPSPTPPKPELYADVKYTKSEQEEKEYDVLSEQYIAAMSEIETYGTYASIEGLADRSTYKSHKDDKAD